MNIAHVVLGGCLSAPPLAIGLTPDTGGHLVYALGAARAMALLHPASHVTLYGRAFTDARLGLRYARRRESVLRNCEIVRLATRSAGYLDKDALAHELDSFTDALIAEIEGAAHRPDALHAHFADAGIVALRVRDRFGIPVVYSAHSLAREKAASSVATDRNLHLRLEQENEVIARADAILASSRDEAERQLAAYPGHDAARVHVVPPGVDLPDDAGEEGGDDAALLRPFLTEPDRPLLLAVARPVARKNLPLLVDILAGTPGLKDRANLAILAGQRDALDTGCDEARGVWRQIVGGVDRHDLYGRVAYPKRHAAADVRALYRHAARTGGVFLNPAGSEPFGLTVIEAAAAGVPVVTTDRGGPRDIVASLGHGRIADPRDGSAFGAAIMDLIGDCAAWEEASRNGRARVGRYSWSGYARGFAAVVRGLRAVVRPRVHRAGPRALLVCDMDNTLTGHAGGAAQFAKWREASRGDVIFAVATGRRGAAALAILDRWGLPHPDVLIGSVGTEVDWSGQGGGYAREEDFMEGEHRRWCADTVEGLLAGMPGLTPQPRSEQRRWKRSYLFAAPADLRAIRRRLERGGQRVRLVLSHDILLDVMPAGAGKARAVSHVASTLGIAPERVVAAGDSGNDADMLTRARHAIVVGNHHPELTATGVRRRAYTARGHGAAGVMEGLARLDLARGAVR